MTRRDGQTHGFAGEFFEAQSPQHGSSRTDRESQVQLAFANARQHFLGGQIMQLYANTGSPCLEGAQYLGENADGGGGRIADMKDALSAGRNCARSFDGVVDSLQDSPGFGEESSSGFGQSDGFGAAFEQKKSEFFFEVTELPAQGRLRHVEL